MGVLDRRMGKPVRLASVRDPWRVLCVHTRFFIRLVKICYERVKDELWRAFGCVDNNWDGIFHRPILGLEFRRF